MADLLVYGGRIVSPSGIIEANLIITDGKIEKITKRDVAADEKVDAKGKFIIPGLIDSHVHFRDPGQTYKEDWKSGSSAAAAGGVTSVCDMPNNAPSITTAKRFEEKRKIAEKKSIIDFGLYFGATNDNSGEIKKIDNLAGVKFFLGQSTGDLLFDIEGLGDYLKAIRERNLLSVFHCEKRELLEKYKKEKFKYFSDIRPAICEAMSIRDVATAMHNDRIHICHMTSESGLEEIVRAKKLNKNLSCEVTPQHLFLTKDDEKKQGSFLKMFPPLRSNADKTALWHGLRGGLVDMVATDHAPHLPREKELGFEKAPGGVPGVETRLPLVLELTDLRGLIETCCRRPAEILGLRNKGALIQGHDADFVILDPKEEYRITCESIVSKCAWTPFEGMAAKGKIYGTFVAGNCVFDGENVIKNEGRELRFSEKAANEA